MGQRQSVTRPARGFTLIELLVVMLIIALIASVAVLSAPPPTSEARREAEKFAARLNIAAEQAIMSGAMTSLEITEGGYQFYRYEKGVWAPHDDLRLSARAFSPDIAVEFNFRDETRSNERDNRQTGRPASGEILPAPNVFFAPTGETTPLDVTFTTRRAQMMVTLDAVGGLNVVRDERR